MSKAFSSASEINDHMVSIEFIFVVDRISLFTHIEISLNLRDETALIMVDDGWCSRIQFGNILVRNFESIFTQEFGLYFFFLFYWVSVEF